MFLNTIGCDFLNVIIVNDYAYVNGGASMVALNTAILLAGRGHNVILFSAVGPIAEELKRVSNLTVFCLEQHDILEDPNRIRACIQGIWNLKSAKAMKEILGALSPENTVIHIHTLQKAITSSIIPVINKKNFKIVYHAHDYGIACPNLGFYNYSAKKICHIQPLSLRCVFSNCDSRCYYHKIWRIIRQLVQKYIGKIPTRIDKVIFVSNFSKGVLQNYVSNGFVLENPLEIEDRHCVDVKKNKYAIYIGRLSPEKAPQILAKLTAKLNIPVIFVGDGECKQEIKRINPNAIITGWLNKDRMKKFIFQARYLVFPSLCYETQGLVVPEVAAYGIPSIVSDLCAARDFIIDGENGLLFDGGSLKSLENAMLQLQNDNTVAQLGKNAYKKYTNTQSEYIKKLERLYISLV